MTEDDEARWHDDRCQRCGRTRINCECLRPEMRDERDPYDRAMDRADDAYERWASM